MRFVDGLRDDIKSMIMVQRPSNLDTACSLALMQEEAAASGRWRRFDAPSSHSSTKSGVHLSSSARGNHNKDSTPLLSHADKLESLRRYRRAKGLCDKCAEKWSPGHKCVATAQLHAME